MTAKELTAAMSGRESQVVKIADAAGDLVDIEVGHGTDPDTGLPCVVIAPSGSGAKPAKK